MHWSTRTTGTLEPTSKATPILSARLLAVAGLALPFLLAFFLIVFGGDSQQTSSAASAPRATQTR
ncbi:MAG: hypothetical protein SGI92_31630 [Bryobacteraceae bacterium]|nr:hypothetical protein [Bryobacteraceae bacterium]